MANALQQLEDIFTEETFTRKPLINYTVKYFSNLDQIFNEIKKENKMDEVYEMASSHLARNAQQIVSLYISLLVSLEKGEFSEIYSERLITIFKNIKKWNIVEYAAKKVLEYHDSDYALRALAGYYQAMNKEEQAVDIWERLVEIDKENYELAEKIAHVREREEDMQNALKYYKIAFERNIEKKREKAVESLLKKILEIKPNSTMYFAKYEALVSEIIPPDTMIDLWKIVFFHHFEKGEYENSLLAIKHLLNYEQAIVKQNNKKAKYFRHRLVDVYKMMYPNHSLFEQIEELAMLTNVFKEPKSVIEIFEKYIQYDKGKYVYHRNFGSGRITEINTNEVFIVFASSFEEVRKMTFDMAMKSLVVIYDDDIRVYKSYRLAELKKLAEDSPNDLITIVLKYRDGGTITSKDLKHELSPLVISETNYNKWLESAKKSVRANNTVKFDKNTFVYNAEFLSYDAEMLQKFQNQKDYFGKYQIYVDYRNYTKDLSCEEAKEMFAYFSSAAKDKTRAVEERITSVLLLQRIGIKDLPSLDEIIKDVKDYTRVYEMLSSSLYKEKYISVIENNIDNYAEIIKKFLYTTHVKYNHLVIDNLIKTGKIDVLEKTIDNIILKYREYTDSFVFFSQKLLEGNIGNEENKIRYNKTFVMIGLLNLITHLGKMTDKKETSVQSRRLLKIVYDLLFEKRYLFAFIEEENENDVRIVFEEFKKLIELENHYKTEVTLATTKRFPNII